MDSSILDLSLSINLNVSPLHNNIDETPKREFQGDFVDEMKPSGKEENDPMIEELNRMNMENEKLTKMLAVVWKKFNALQSHLAQLKQKDSLNEHASPRKRKAEDDNYGNVIGVYGNTESSFSDGGSSKRPREVKTNVWRIYARTDPSDKSPVVKDGYQWRKYGQKVTRDNPSPRAYYKCSFSPNCPVKKKVQRSAKDSSVVVATYEGEHNHSHPSQDKVSLVSNPGSNSLSLGHTIAHDLMETGLGRTTKMNIPEVKAPLVQQFLVEEMASSLTRNPSFTAALAAAISNKVLDYDSIEGW